VRVNPVAKLAVAGDQVGQHGTLLVHNGKRWRKAGRVAKALGQVSDDLLASPPDIQAIDVIASELGG
jgi:hypothetical protein